MSLRIDSSEWISGALIIGDVGLGVLGSEIASDGDNGPGYAYNDLTLPDDANKEICGRITTWPTLGTLTAYEDTSFEFSGPDGTHSFDYQLYVDGVAVGSPVAVTIVVGASSVTATASIAGLTLSAPLASASGSASAIGNLVALALSAPLGSAFGTTGGDVVAFGSLPYLSLLAPSGSASGTSAGSATGAGSIRAVYLIAPRGAASGTGVISYASAPPGSGYRRELMNTTRPKQRNTTRH